MLAESTWRAATAVDSDSPATGGRPGPGCASPTRRSSRPLVQLAGLAVVWTIMLGCAGAYSLSAAGERVPTGDGHHIWTYALSEPDDADRALDGARAVVFSLAGSLSHARHPSIVGTMGAMAGFVMMQMPVVLVDRRGIEPNDSVDWSVARRFADKPTRVADAARAIRAYLPRLGPGTPVLLLGASEGADVAAAVARKEPRVTHLILLAGGGGMSQAEELELLVTKKAGIFGALDAEGIREGFDAIRAAPDSEAMWLGQPYRRWSTFLWSPLGDDLLELSIPIFAAHGAEDASVPVESSRRLRDSFLAAGKQNFRYVEYPGLDHSFVDLATGRTGLPLVEVDVVGWLREQGLVSREEAERFVERVHEAHPEWWP